jgi:translation initiation factor eIF-2B subunit epsilon
LISRFLGSTIKLSEALEAHKNRREKEKNKDAIMTMVMKASPPQQRSPMFEEDDMAVAINPETGQLVHFQSMRGKAFSVDPAQFEPHTSVAIRYDLDYTYICVCSPEVLCLFTDEFDWLDFHKDFVPGVLTSEILSYQIYTHVATSGYAGRVSCLNSYAAVTHDVLHRWTYPLVPEVMACLNSKSETLTPKLLPEAVMPCLIPRPSTPSLGPLSQNPQS